MVECIKQADESKMEGLLREGVHKELIDEIMSLSEEEVVLVTRLLASLQI